MRRGVSDTHCVALALHTLIIDNRPLVAIQSAVNRGLQTLSNWWTIETQVRLEMTFHPGCSSRMPEPLADVPCQEV